MWKMINESNPGVLSGFERLGKIPESYQKYLTDQETDEP